MTDELPEKVWEWLDSRAHETTQGRMWPYISRREVEEIAHLAIEESTRELREKLENAEEGYARRHKDATDLWEKINFPGGLNEQIERLRERLERAQGALRECPGITGDYSVCWPDKHALAIREAKEAAHD